MKNTFIAFIFKIMFLSFAGTTALAALPMTATVSERDLALLALQSLGAPVTGSSNRCAGCHGLSGATFQRWADATRINQEFCMKGLLDIASPTVAQADELLHCWQKGNGDADPTKMGFWAAGVQTLKVKTFFAKAYGENSEVYSKLVRQAQMPMNENVMTDAEFDNVIHWTHMGTPYMAELLSETSLPPPQCEPSERPELKEFLRDRKYTNWRSLNELRGLPMFGCGNEVGLKCFHQLTAAGEPTFPEISSLKANGAELDPALRDQSLRLMADLPRGSSYWTRSSPDGRYIAHGLNEAIEVGDRFYGSAIYDLKELRAGGAKSMIPVVASYDPGFFPDGSGFSFQGTDLKGTIVCRLKDLLSPLVMAITGEESFCSDNSLSLYHSVGASLNGMDQWAFTGEFNGEAGGEEEAYFSSESALQGIPLRFDGDKFQWLKPGWVRLPYEGDFISSPSAELFISRSSAMSKKEETFIQDGYTVRFLKKSIVDDRGELESFPMARFCQHGGKGTFSYDERFIAFHVIVKAEDFKDLGYASAEDPEFKALVERPNFNIYLHDLWTEKTHRLTSVKPGTRLLYPHFRSDGWIYFIKREGDTEALMASDAALLLEKANPIVDLELQKSRRR